MSFHKVKQLILNHELGDEKIDVRTYIYICTCNACHEKQQHFL